MKEPLRYPLKKIDSFDDYLKIEILEYKAPGLSTQENSFALNTSDNTYGNESNVTILETIYLPIPETNIDNNSANWGSGSTMGPIEAAAVSAGTQIMNDLSVENIMNVGSEKLENVIRALNTGTGQNAIKMGLAGAAIKNLLGEKAGGNYLERGAGITFNENVELIFNGVNLRDAFQFSFNITPRSDDESVIIKKIIRSFKKYSSVKKGLDFGDAEGLFLKAPEVFRIRYMNGSKPHPFFNKFKICALISMSVDYSSERSYASYWDGTPVSLRLTLTFKELTPIYYEDYLSSEEGGSDDGIGVGY